MGDLRGEEWFESLFRRHHASVRGYCSRRVSGDVDDLVAIVFGVAWRKRASVPDPALPWLYAVAAREVLHRHRSEGRRAGYEERAAARREPAADPFAEVDDRLARRGAIATAMGRLRPADAEILRLWAWEDLSAPEIAVVLEISAATARVRLHRARLRMQAQVRAMDVPHAESPAHLCHATFLETGDLS